MSKKRSLAELMKRLGSPDVDCLNLDQVRARIKRIRSDCDQVTRLVTMQENQDFVEHVCNLAAKYRGLQLPLWLCNNQFVYGTFQWLTPQGGLVRVCFLVPGLTGSLFGGTLAQTLLQEQEYRLSWNGQNLMFDSTVVLLDPLVHYDAETSLVQPLRAKCPNVPVPVRQFAQESDLDHETIVSASLRDFTWVAGPYGAVLANPKTLQSVDAETARRVLWPHAVAKVCVSFLVPALEPLLRKYMSI